MLMEARTHSPFHHDDYEIHITADFSKETNDHRKAFLALQPCLHQLEVKYGLFELARMWIPKTGQSKDVYDPEDLRLFLDRLTTTAMDMTPSIPPSELDMGRAPAGYRLSGPRSPLPRTQALALCYTPLPHAPGQDAATIACIHLPA
ncbi:hypothetical protein NDU88_005712 [Pleurodeles waltl]|uniref:Uncharacterized protein n=1 Tax=Pleurodeles waltl TaxID=8319 RepID=A0AAV7WXV5_PLEWA|nr:hypothetical protein NDU88_005712 [Pleurodeles waltl]